MADDDIQRYAQQEQGAPAVKGLISDYQRIWDRNQNLNWKERLLLEMQIVQGRTGGGGR
jgi:hypothetical protein